MHCCGTSLTARLLNILGYDLGTDGQHSDSTSPSRTGARRQSPLSEINDAIFDTLGGTWWRPPEMAADWERRREIQALRQDALQAIQSEFGDSTRWAWRDPRTSLTLAFWRDLVPDARWVICMRSPIEAASSLLSREPGELSWDVAVQLWLRHLASAFEYTHERRRLLVFYEDYFYDQDRQFDRLASFAGIDPANVSQSSRDEMRAVIDPGLRHHRASVADVAQADSVSLEARVLFLAARAAQVASAAGAESGFRTDAIEPDLVDAIARIVPRLSVGAAERERLAAAEQARNEALAMARSERDDARRAERHHRIALDHALAELDSAVEEIKTTRRDADREDRALVKATGDLTRARNTRRALERSLTWRLTRPLRTLSELLLGLHRQASAARSWHRLRARGPLDRRRAK